MEAGAARLEHHGPSVRGPAGDVILGGVPGEPPRHAAVRLDDVDVHVAVVLAREGDERPVRGEERLRLAPGPGRQPPRLAARARHAPQIAGEGEDHAGAAHGRLLQEQRRRGVRRRRGPGLCLHGGRACAAPEHGSERQGDEQAAASAHLAPPGRSADSTTGWRGSIAPHVDTPSRPSIPSHPGARACGVGPVRASPRRGGTPGPPGGRPLRLEEGGRPAVESRRPVRGVRRRLARREGGRVRHGPLPRGRGGRRAPAPHVEQEGRDTPPLQPGRRVDRLPLGPRGRKGAGVPDEPPGWRGAQDHGLQGGRFRARVVTQLEAAGARRLRRGPGRGRGRRG